MRIKQSFQATDRSLVFSKDLLRFPGFKGLRIWWFILFIVYCNHIKGRRTESDGEIHHQLLDHPLVKALVRRKWNDIGVKFHVLNLALYMIYLVVLTVCVCTTVPPYINSQYVLSKPFAEIIQKLPQNRKKKSPNNLFTYLNTTVCQNVTLCQNETSCQNGNTCKNTTKCLDTTTCLNKTTTEAAVTKMACHSFESQRMSVIVDLQYFVIALSFIMILKEIYQLVRVYGREYFKQKENYVELAVYIFSVLFVVNVTECEHTDYRTEWQWALGTLSVFMAWINLLVFGKKFEHLGIYVMMLWSIIKTFLVNVFPIVAVLLMAFSIAFTCVHQDQMKFANVWHSLLTTSSLMISGFDYDEFLSLANYHDIASVSYIIYSLFQLLMTIVIINLMVGVAVENVQEIHKDASATNTVLQIEYILELERMICLISTKLKNICKIKEFMERFISKQKEEIELTQLQSTRLPVQQIMAVLDKNKAENEQDGILERINQIEMTMTKKLNTIGKQMTEINFMIERQLTLLNSTTKDTNERMSTVETRLIELNSTTKETNESINTVET